METEEKSVALAAATAAATGVQKLKLIELQAYFDLETSDSRRPGTMTSPAALSCLCCYRQLTAFVYVL